MHLPHLPPLALYVHLPWCLRKCPYCDFNSHEIRGPFPEAAYVDALLADLEAAAPAAQGRALQSVFIGGGTPSLFTGEAIARLLTGVRARLPLAPAAEITLEANPGAAEADRFAAYREAGVTRLSLGVQSFDSTRLRALGRVHDGAEAQRAVELALRHFGRVNLDLMYALPGQDAAAATADVRTALASGVGHLSCYQLTIEPNTVFANRPPARLPDDDAAATIESAVHGELAGAGFTRYEISAWSRPGEECRHNLNYWWFGDYLGIGAGAHAKLSFPERIVRESRTRAPADYLRRAPAGAAVVEQRELVPAERVFEFLMNALRLPRGFPEKLLAERTGATLAAAEPGLGTAIGRELLERRAGEIRPTALGLRFLNELLALFLPPTG